MGFFLFSSFQSYVKFYVGIFFSIQTVLPISLVFILGFLWQESLERQLADLKTATESAKSDQSAALEELQKTNSEVSMFGVFWFLFRLSAFEVTEFRFLLTNLLSNVKFLGLCDAFFTMRSTLILFIGHFVGFHQFQFFGTFATKYFRSRGRWLQRRTNLSCQTQRTRSCLPCAKNSMITRPKLRNTFDNWFVVFFCSLVSVIPCRGLFCCLP